MFREILFQYRSNKAGTVMLVCQITVFFVLIGTFCTFTGELHAKKSDIEDIYDNKAIYHLLDGYYDPDEFSAFLQQPNALNILKNYYNALNTADSFSYLAMFNQGINVDSANEKFPDEVSWADGEQSKQVQSFQVNEQASEYFHLSVSDGRTFSAEDFEEHKDAVPILLGADYKDVFAVGDRIPANYYRGEVVLEVAGILQENTFVYYNGDPEFYLDDYIIFPYMNYQVPETESEESCQKIVYFAMINGYIVIEPTDEAASTMLAELEAISEKTGFFNYSFIGSNPNIQKYRGLINIINRNYDLVKTLLALSFFVNMAVIGLQFYAMIKKRLYSMAVHYLYGASLQDLIKQLAMEVLCIIAFSAALGWMILSPMRIAEPQGVLTILLLAAAMMAGVSFASIYKLKNAQLMMLLNQEEELE